MNSNPLFPFPKVFDVFSGPDRHILDHFLHFGLDPTKALKFSDLSGMDFSLRNLHDFDFFGANFQDTNLAGSDVYGANFLNSNITDNQLLSAYDWAYCIPPKSSNIDPIIKSILPDYESIDEYSLQDEIKKYTKNISTYLQRETGIRITINNDYGIILITYYQSTDHRKTGIKNINIAEKIIKSQTRYKFKKIVTNIMENHDEYGLIEKFLSEKLNSKIITIEENDIDEFIKVIFHLIL